jgi:Ca2+-binding EF-hand superfamily protein
MATQDQTRELTEKVESLISARFGGDFHAAFRYYDSDGDGRVSKDDLGNMLSDARIGNWLTRNAWADGVIAALDTDRDGYISSAEFFAILRK